MIVVGVLVGLFVGGCKQVVKELFIFPFLPVKTMSKINFLPFKNTFAWMNCCSMCLLSCVCLCVCVIWQVCASQRGAEVIEAARLSVQ